MDRQKLAGIIIGTLSSLAGYCAALGVIDHGRWESLCMALSISGMGLAMRLGYVPNQQEASTLKLPEGK